MQTALCIEKYKNYISKEFFSKLKHSSFIIAGKTIHMDNPNKSNKKIRLDEETQGQRTSNWQPSQMPGLLVYY